MILYDTKYLQLKSTKSKNGNDWVYAHRPNAKDVVVIVPIIENSKTLFLIEERPPIKAENIAEYTIAFPAGLVGDVRINESVIDAIHEELLEETGLKADRVEIKAAKIATSPGCVSETYTIAFAYISIFKEIAKPVDDDGVIIKRVPVNIKDINNWLNEQTTQGMLLTSQTLSALYILEREKL